MHSMGRTSDALKMAGVCALLLSMGCAGQYRANPHEPPSLRPGVLQAASPDLAVPSATVSEGAVTFWFPIEDAGRNRQSCSLPG